MAFCVYVKSQYRDIRLDKFQFRDICLDKSMEIIVLPFVFVMFCDSNAFPCTEIVFKNTQSTRKFWNIWHYIKYDYALGLVLWRCNRNRNRIITYNNYHPAMCTIKLFGLPIKLILYKICTGHGFSIGDRPVFNAVYWYESRTFLKKYHSPLSTSS